MQRKYLNTRHIVKTRLFCERYMCVICIYIREGSGMCICKHAFKYQKKFDISY